MPRIDSTTTQRGPVESIRQAPLLGLFLLNGLLMSSWLARIPAVRDDLSLTPAELGTLLPLGAIGTIAVAAVASSVLVRLGGASALLVATVGHGCAFTLLGAACATGSTALLVVGLVVNGGAFSLGNLPVNVESAGLERRAGRPILSRFHAAYSVGTVLGSLVGVVCAATGVAVLAQFLATAVVAVVWRWTALPHVIHDTRRVNSPAARAGSASDGDGAPRARRSANPAGAGRAAGAPWRESRILLLGLIVLSATVCEGAAGDWLSLAVVDGFGHSDAGGAAVFAVFVSSMAAVRIAGTWITGRLGRTATLRASAATAAAGVLLFATAPVFPLAVLGVVAWGLGTGLVVPLAVSAASEDPTKTAGRVALVTGLASFASLAAPPVLGAAASAVGPRSALVLVLVVTVVVLALSRHAAPGAGGGASASAAPTTAPDAATDPSADLLDAARLDGIDRAAFALKAPAAVDPAVEVSPAIAPAHAVSPAVVTAMASPVPGVPAVEDPALGTGLSAAAALTRRHVRMVRHRGLLAVARARRLKWRQAIRQTTESSGETAS